MTIIKVFEDSERGVSLVWDGPKVSIQTTLFPDGALQAFVGSAAEFKRMIELAGARPPHTFNSIVGTLSDFWVAVLCKIFVAQPEMECEEEER